jgi:hypothetical protein
VTVTLTKPPVIQYDIETRTVWSRMSHQDGERDIAAVGWCHDNCGDIYQDYDTTDRGGNPCRVVLWIEQGEPLAGNAVGVVYVIPAP